MSQQPRSLFGPLLLITAGVVWLLTKSGAIPASSLWALTHIWPYFLIAAGIGLILRSYWKYATVVLDVLIIGGAVLAILFAPQLGWDNPSIVSINDGDFNLGPGKSASGNVVTETREAGEFTAIQVDYPAQVFVTQGKSPSITIEAQKDVLPGLQTRVQNGSLDIFYKVSDGEGVNPTKLVKITIVVADLNEVAFDSAGELSIDGLEVDELELSISGAGNMKLNNITTKNLVVSLSGVGSMTASGETDEFSLNISGFGSFDGKDLKSRTADVSLSGAGSATIWVEDELDAEVSGVGSVNYYGSPNVNKQVSGIGGVTKAGDK